MNVYEDALEKMKWDDVKAERNRTEWLLAWDVIEKLVGEHTKQLKKDLDNYGLMVQDSEWACTEFCFISEFDAPHTALLIGFYESVKLVDKIFECDEFVIFKVELQNGNLAMLTQDQLFNHFEPKG